MFEDVRRAMSHRREAREKEKLRKLERSRRLSHIRMKRLEERETFEKGLSEQAGAELTAQRSAMQALRERKQMERELRTARGPGTGMRVVRGVGKVTKGVFYDFPVKSARVAAKLGKGQNLQRVLIGDTHFVLGTPKAIQRREPPSQSLNEFMFGPPTKPLPRDKKDIDIFGGDRDILR